MSTPVRPFLVIDDDLDQVIITRMVLERVAPGAIVETCTDPRAVEDRLASAAEHAIVLLDRVLDGDESISVAARSRDARPDLYLVLLSASLSPEDRQRALRAGFAEALEKVATVAAWQALLSGVMQRAALGRQIEGEASQAAG